MSQKHSSPAPWWRRHYYAPAIATVVVGAAVGLGCVELWIRLAKIMPRTQIVRGYGLHAVDGDPVWQVSADRENRACVEQHPERTRILFLGSSITYGTSLDADEVFTKALQERLNEQRPQPGFCVLNFAQPAFAFQQKYAVARVEVPRYRPALILWENWVEWWDYALIGEAAYSTRDLVIRPDGFVGMAGMPDGLNRSLFLHSRLYEYLALGYGERLPPPPDSAAPGKSGEHQTVAVFTKQKLTKLPALAQSVGAKLAFYLAPSLDRPFAETVASPLGWQEEILEFANDNHIPAYLLQRELSDKDYLELRMDPCCHYNAQGHRALVPVMQRIVLEQLEGAVAGQPMPIREVPSP